MSNTTFRSPRLLDRQLIAALHQIASETPIQNTELYFVPFEGAGGQYVAFDAVDTNEILKEVLQQNGAVIQTLALVQAKHPQGKRHFVTIRRLGKELFDEVDVRWYPEEPRLPEPQFARLIGLAKTHLKELKLDGSFAGFSNTEIDKYYAARDATLTQLERVSSELLFKTHERLRELDQEFQQRVERLNADIAAQREALKNDADAKDLLLSEKQKELEKRQSEFDMRESKYLRRQLRKDMLERLAALSQKFELTQGTRKLRLPITVFTWGFIAFFATMTVLSFTQTAEIIKTAGQDVSKLNWWQLGFLGLKQLGFAAAFLGGAWFYIKWNDRWFRQHADSEFMFKQLELDINRASWVVEMALEWKDEKGRELPAELLDRLTRNLFKQVPQPHDEDETPRDIATVLLGAAANLKVKSPSGAELEFDRKGLRSAIKESL